MQNTIVLISQMRRNGEPKAFADASAMHPQINARNHRSLPHLENVGGGSPVTRIEDGHVMFVVADVVIDDAVAGVNALSVAVALLLDDLFEATTIITT